MRQQAMRYKDFTWPHNPANLEISLRRNIGAFVLPRAGELLQDCLLYTSPSPRDCS